MPQTAVADPETGLTLEQLAARHGLSSAGKLPSLPAYIRQLWAYRHFISSYANAKASSSLGNTQLGMLWQVLTPLINAARLLPDLRRRAEHRRRRRQLHRVPLHRGVPLRLHPDA